MPDHSLVEQHGLVLQSVTDAILVTGVGGVVECANDEAHQLFNAKRTLRDLRLAHREHAAALRAAESYRAHGHRCQSGDGGHT